MAKESPKLLPCPFCEGKDFRISDKGVVCLSCEAEGPAPEFTLSNYQENVDDGIKKWNNRPDILGHDSIYDKLVDDIYKLFKEHSELIQEYLLTLVQSEHDRDGDDDGSKDDIYLKNKRMSLHGAFQEIEILQIEFSNMMKRREY